MGRGYIEGYIYGGKPNGTAGIPLGNFWFAAWSLFNNCFLSCLGMKLLIITGLLLFSNPGKVFWLNSSIAFLALSSDVKHTNPKPLDVSDSTNLSLILVTNKYLLILADLISPHFENISFNLSSVKS